MTEKEIIKKAIVEVYRQKPDIQMTEMLIELEALIALGHKPQLVASCLKELTATFA